MRVSWTARRANQSILKEISPEYSLERLMLKLKFQYFGHLMNEAILLSHHWKGHHFLEESHLDEMLTQLGNDVNEKQYLL